MSQRQGTENPRIEGHRDAGICIPRYIYIYMRAYRYIYTYIYKRDLEAVLFRRVRSHQGRHMGGS